MLESLANDRRWIVYRRSTKSPVIPDAPQYDLDAQKPDNWLTGERAQQWATYLGAEFGVGIVLTKGCGIACVDIDHAWNGVEWSPLARELSARFAGAYQEVSQGHTGLHIFFSYTGEMPEHRKKNVPLGIEFYSELRFIGVTGYNAAGDVKFDATSLVPNLIRDYFIPAVEANPDGWTSTPAKAWDGPEDDDELIRRMLASRPSVGAMFGSRASVQQLWANDVAALARAFPAKTVGKDYDGSSVDQAIANHVAFWTGGDCDRMLRIMLLSKLARPKWEREGYIRGTILKATAGQTKFYKQRADAATAEVPEGSPFVPPDAATTPAAPLVADGIALPPNAPPVDPPPAMGRGDIVRPEAQVELFKGYTYVQDIHRIVTPMGTLLDSSRFDVEFGGRMFMMDKANTVMAPHAWECYTQSGMVEFPRVRGTLFDPLGEPGTTVMRDGMKFINVWAPVVIRAEPGDPTRFVRHLQILFPLDWRILLNYLKFMVQHKGRKSTWWPFLQGVPGNGKSFISATMQYCIGKRYTQKPTPKNIDSQFNASLYACLFVALEDVKVKEDHGALWETLKPMITETEIEIQPKGVDKVTREICFNGILNSNHKDGIRKEPDDRRLAPFFAAQQRKSDLARDGLTPAYFDDLWSWALGDGWAHVCHYLATDPIDEEYNPATRCKVAPLTSSTDEAIALGMGTAEQELVEAVRAKRDGFKGGWVASHKFDMMLEAIGKSRSIPRMKRREMLATFNYVPHPGLDDGRMPVPLTDGHAPTLYVLDGHASSKFSDVMVIKGLYEAAQRA